MECCSTAPARLCHEAASPTACLSAGALHTMGSSPAQQPQHGFSNRFVFFERAACFNKPLWLHEAALSTQATADVIQASPTYLMSAGTRSFNYRLTSLSAQHGCLPQVHRPLGTALEGWRGTAGLCSPWIVGLQQHRAHGEGS